VEEWLVLLPDHHEPYVDREQFERIQEMISKNGRDWQEPGSGAPKKGPALLSTLLRCRRCGRKLIVRYTGRRHDVERYVCGRGALDNGEERCINFGGRPVDDAVSREILRVLRPGGIEAARYAEEAAAQRRDDARGALELALREARYRAERMRRQYDAADPENRLVVDELERRWNVALEEVAEIESRLSGLAGRRDCTAPLSGDVLRDLGGDFKRVWHDPDADVRLKKRILRTLIEEIVVDVDREAGMVALVIHWKGGIHTKLGLPARRRGQNRLHTAPEVVEAVGILVRTCTDDVIAGVLNRNGMRTGHGNRWTRERVRSLRGKRGIPAHSRERQEAEGWMTLTQAAAYLGLGPKTVRRAVERGTVTAVHPLADGPWVFRREDLETPAVRDLVRRVKKGPNHPAGQGTDDVSLFPSTHPPDEAL
jgi:excisionase family DNA binding protein